MNEKINELKRAKNALILAHYYAPPEVQQAADHVGDSFYLAKVAKQSRCDVIVFCGVGFMGESAKILAPEKKVLMPAPEADCAMAHMVRDGAIEALRAELTGIVYSANAELAGRLWLRKHCPYFIQSERNDLFTILGKKKKQTNTKKSVRGKGTSCKS